MCTGARSTAAGCVASAWNTPLPPEALTRRCGGRDAPPAVTFLPVVMTRFSCPARHLPCSSVPVRCLVRATKIGCHSVRAIASSNPSALRRRVSAYCVPPLASFSSPPPLFYLFSFSFKRCPSGMHCGRLVSQSELTSPSNNHPFCQFSSSTSSGISVALNRDFICADSCSLT